MLDHVRDGHHKVHEEVLGRERKRGRRGRRREEGGGWREERRGRGGRRGGGRRRGGRGGREKKEGKKRGSKTKQLIHETSLHAYPTLLEETRPTTAKKLYIAATGHNIP